MTIGDRIREHFEGVDPGDALSQLMPGDPEYREAHCTGGAEVLRPAALN